MRERSHRSVEMTGRWSNPVIFPPVKDISVAASRGERICAQLMEEIT